MNAPDDRVNMLQVRRALILIGDTRMVKRNNLNHIESSLLHCDVITFSLPPYFRRPVCLID